MPVIVVGVVIAAIATLSIYYLVRGQPLLVQGEVDARRFDIAARVDGRVGEIPVARGQNVAANAVLVRIDNPETIAKHEQALAAKVVADASSPISMWVRGRRSSRRARLDGAQAALVLAQQTYERVRTLAEHGNAPPARLDQATDSLRRSNKVPELRPKNIDCASHNNVNSKMNLTMLCASCRHILK